MRSSESPRKCRNSHRYPLITTPTRRRCSCAPCGFIRRYARCMSASTMASSYMVSNIGGDAGKKLHDRLGAPQEAVFANEIVAAEADGRLKDTLALPRRGRPCRRTAQCDLGLRSSAARLVQGGETKRCRGAQRSLCLLPAAATPGFTLSRSFAGSPGGVMGTDLAAVDLARFLSEQDITKTSTAFIFTKTGEIVVAPGFVATGRCPDRTIKQ